MLEDLDSLAEIEQCSKDPATCFVNIAKAGTPGAKKWAVINVKPKIEVYLHDQGLQWSDVQPVLETVDSIAELETAKTDPAGFFKRVAAALVAAQLEVLAGAALHGARGARVTGAPHGTGSWHQGGVAFSPSWAILTAGLVAGFIIPPTVVITTILCFITRSVL